MIVQIYIDDKLEIEYQGVPSYVTIKEVVKKFTLDHNWHVPYSCVPARSSKLGDISVNGSVMIHLHKERSSVSHQKIRSKVSTL